MGHGKIYMYTHKTNIYTYITKHIHAHKYIYSKIR